VIQVGQKKQGDYALAKNGAREKKEALTRGEGKNQGER